MAKLLLLISTLLSTAIAGNVEPAIPENPAEVQPVPIRKESPDFNGPRTPIYSKEITAYYQSGVVYFQFSENIGCMEILITNVDTTESWTDYACSEFGSESIVTSSASGNYTVSIVTDNSVTYSGEYTLE